jgi:hypothetical protein
MKCYYHPDRDAVAQCSECHKGLCSECAHDAGGATLCPTDFNAGIDQEVARTRRRVIGVWVFTVLVGSFFAIGAVAAAFTPSERGGIGPAGLLLVPVAFYGAWSLFWGWGPTWRTFQRFFGGWGCFGSWILILIVLAVIFEFLLGAALLVGAFTGIQRYRDDRLVLARAPGLRAMTPK